MLRKGHPQNTLEAFNSPLQRAAVEELLTHTTVTFGLFPIYKGARELAINQEYGKKAAKSLSHVLDSVCEALHLFLSGLRETTGDTRITKSRVDNPGIGEEVVVGPLNG